MRLPISCLCIGTLSLERDPVILDCTQVGSCNGAITFNETALSLLRGLITTGYLFRKQAHKWGLLSTNAKSSLNCVNGFQTTYHWRSVDSLDDSVWCSLCFCETKDPQKCGRLSVSKPVFWCLHVVAVSPCLDKEVTVCRRYCSSIWKDQGGLVALHPPHQHHLQCLHLCLQPSAKWHFIALPLNLMSMPDVLDVSWCSKLFQNRHLAEAPVMPGQKTVPNSLRVSAQLEADNSDNLHIFT